MRRLALLSVLLCLALTDAASAAPPPPVKVTVDACGTVTSRKLPGVAFGAEMPYVTGAASMWMRFDLQRRRAGETEFTRVPNDGGGWYREKPARVFRYDDKIFVVPDLVTTTDYRARVTFRWNDASGAPLLVVRRTTPTCRLAALPDLKAGALTVQPGGAGEARYAVVVRNAGGADAGPFDVALRIGTRTRAVSIGGLAADSSQAVVLDGPRCTPGDVLRVELDAADRVREADERDNVLVAACPA